MTSDDFNAIETALEIELPGYYRDFMQNYPDALLAEGFHAAGMELLNTAQRIIELNQQVQTSHDIDPGDSYFLIGESGCGGYYFIDPDEVDSPVYFWNHEIGEFDDDEESASLPEHAGKLLDIYRDVRQER